MHNTGCTTVGGTLINNLLPPFQIIGRLGFIRFIDDVMLLDIHYV
jgi:hypothetical protein